ncbi:hypothetical protein CAEBREN_11627 [Caenorhabditis brenneri]|uniref:Uncharacterized protein n=1 Tax=Caenorhabditis brenneri TaxID=135651 RepID=G0NXK8_CAEBE|nr:hypothetical protein CAEBREN_11627 [Caenorhabditis brenneri]
MHHSPPQVHLQSPPRQQLKGTAPAQQEEKCQCRLEQPHVPAPKNRPISVARTIKEEPVVPDQDVGSQDRDVERIADPGYKTRDVILPDSGNKDWNKWTTVDLVSWIKKILDGWFVELQARAEVVKLHWDDMKNWERRNKRKH